MNDDTISRQAAIEAITNYAKFLWNNFHEKCNSAGMIDAIEALPTIDPVKRGRWEKTYLDHEAIGERPSIFYCSVCNQCIAYPVNYCPSCGADMRGEEDENNNQI